MGQWFGYYDEKNTEEKYQKKLFVRELMKDLQEKMIKQDKLVEKRKITGAKNFLYIVEPNVEINNENNVWEGSLKALKSSFSKIQKEGHNKLESKLKANRKEN